MVEKFTSEISMETIVSSYPGESAAAHKLLYDYLNLIKIAKRLGMLNPSQILEIENENANVSNTFERLHLQAAGVLRRIKDSIYQIKVPEDKKAFEEWVKTSEEYPRVVCHDGFFDVFINAKKELTAEK